VRGQRAFTGAEIEDEVVGADPGSGHDPRGPGVSERMPAPGPP
jgi:hypothetical protein